MHVSYILGGVQLGGSVVEKDLGILVNRKLNNGMQCQAAVSKASKVLSCIKRGMDSRERDIILSLYKLLVRPHPEYAVQFWGTKSAEKGNQTDKRHGVAQLSGKIRGTEFILS